MEDTSLRDKEFYLTSGRQYTDKVYKNYYNMYRQIRYDCHYKLRIFFFSNRSDISIDVRNSGSIWIGRACWTS